MCNCGNKRKGYAASVLQQESAMPSLSGTPSQPADVLFAYTGKSGLTVSGMMTGKKYRFAFPGDQQLVDYRDAGGMMAVPMLKKIKTAAV